MDDVVGTSVTAETAVIFDWENWWAIDNVAGFVQNKGYEAACVNHYRPFWKSGIPVDVVNMDRDFSPYRLLIAPMLYMLRPGVAGANRELRRTGRDTGDHLPQRHRG